MRKECDTRGMQEEIDRLWPLSENYEYTAEIGMALRQRFPEIWQEWHSEAIAERYPPVQARSYRFVQFLEKEHPQLLRATLPEIIGYAPEHMQREWEASLAIPENFSLEEETVAFQKIDIPLYAPKICREYNNQSRELWEWTEEALRPSPGEGQVAKREFLLRVHDRDYLDRLQAFANQGGGALTPETIIKNSSWEAILAASGSMREAALDVWRERSRALVFAAPGSHHASRSRACGTCLVNHLALAGEELRYQRGVNRVAILDIDAHHGNGTEEIFLHREDVLTVSVHQAQPFFPGTGYQDMPREGTRNISVHPEESWTDATEEAIEAVRLFQPDVLLVQFGGDAHRDDRASDLRASFDDFARAGEMISNLKTPLLVELGSSTNRSSWIGSLRSFVQGLG